MSRLDNKNKVLIEMLGMPSVGKTTTAFKLMAELREGGVLAEFKQERAKILALDGTLSKMSPKDKVLMNERCVEDVKELLSCDGAEVVVRDNSYLSPYHFGDLKMDDALKENPYWLASRYSDYVENLTKDCNLDHLAVALIILNGEGSGVTEGRIESTMGEDSALRLKAIDNALRFTMWLPWDTRGYAVLVRDVTNIGNGVRLADSIARELRIEF